MATEFDAHGISVPGFDFTTVELASCPEALQRFIVQTVSLVRELGRRPTAVELEEHRGITKSQVTYYANRFETLLRLAGYRPTSTRRFRGSVAYSLVTREMVIQVFQDLAQPNGEPPSNSQLCRMHQDGKIPFGSSTITRLFGSHNAAVVAAGLTPRKSGRPIRFTKQTATLALIKWIGVHGRPPTDRDYRSSPDLPSPDRMISLFDGLDNALLAVGQKPHSGQVYSDDELIELLRKFYALHGRWPITADFGHGYLPHEFCYQGRFRGNIPEALSRAQA